MQISNEGNCGHFCSSALVAGWLAGKIVRGTGFGIIGDILVGIARWRLSPVFLFPKVGPLALGTGIVPGEDHLFRDRPPSCCCLIRAASFRTGGRF